METGNLTAARVNGNKFADSSLDHPPELWAAPSLAPTETLAARDILFRQDAFGEEYRLQPPGSDRAETETSFGPPRTLRERLHTKGERVQRQVVEYTTMSQAAMQSMTIIGESAALWKKIPGHSHP